MEPGRLRHRIHPERLTSAPNKYGEPVETWAPIATVYAAREDLTGREAFLAQQVKAEVTTRFVLRYRADLDAAMRIRSDGITYDVASVADPDGTKRQLVIMATREG